MADSERLFKDIPQIVQHHFMWLCFADVMHSHSEASTLMDGGYMYVCISLHCCRFSLLIKFTVSIGVRVL